MNTRNPWLTIPRPKPEAALRVFCFPYAGGGTHVFFSWTKKLTAPVELCLVELPGRGRRISEEPFSSMQPLVEAVTTALLPALAEKPFALYGHSMGSLVSFELARQLRRTGAAMPVALLPSGGRAPQLRQFGDSHTLSDDKFLKMLKKLNGTPQEVFDNEELLEFMLPVLRADFAVCDTYAHQDEPPLQCPIIAFGGTRDYGASGRALAAWSKLTTAHFQQHEFPGDHFFIRGTEAQFLPTFDRVLTELAEAIQNESRE